MQLLADSELQASKHCLNRQLKSGGMPGEPAAVILLAMSGQAASSTQTQTQHQHAAMRFRKSSELSR